MPKNLYDIRDMLRERVNAKPRAKSVDFEDGWWKVRFTSPRLDSQECYWGDMRDEIRGWLFANIEQAEPRLYHQPRHARYVAFRNEDDAALCLMRFS